MSRLGRPAAVLVAAATVLVLPVREGGTAERHAAGADRGSPAAATPANDELAGALLVREVPTTIRASGSGATRGAGDPACASGSHTLWYRLRPAAGGRFVATLRASTGEVCVLVRDGAGLREISQIVGEPDLGDPQSGAFGAEEGTTYYIFVGLEFSDPRYARFTLTVEPATAFVPTWPNDVAVGADGALWFTSSHGRASIGRATASGGVKRHFAPARRAPGALTVGRDGALWFTDVRSVGRISTGGAITMHSDKRLAGPVAITAGEGGFVWFTDYDVGRGEGGVVGRIAAGEPIRLYRDPRIAAPEGIMRGPDGAVWFTNAAGGSIGRIDSAGRISFFTDPRIVAPGPITSGPDGALWFTMAGDRRRP